MIKKLEGAQRVHISTKWICLQLIRWGGRWCPIKPSLYLEPFSKSRA